MPVLYLFLGMKTQQDANLLLCFEPQKDRVPVLCHLAGLDPDRANGNDVLCSTNILRAYVTDLPAKMNFSST